MKMIDDQWTYPEKSSIMDGEPFFSPDGKYIFFGSVGKDRIWGIYWVDARIIDKLKPKDQIMEAIK